MASELGVQTIQHTNGTDALTIDSSGRILQPAKPSFSARAIGSADVPAAGEYFVLTDVDHNTGNCYNSSNGIFTAPVAGVYFFAMQAMGNNGGGRVMFRLRKNNNDYAFASADTEEYNDCSLTITLQLSANDTVRMYAQTAGWYSAQSKECWFCGHLIA